jgi:hypothetical protein
VFLGGDWVRTIQADPNGSAAMIVHRLGKPFKSADQATKRKRTALAATRLLNDNRKR